MKKAALHLSLLLLLTQCGKSGAETIPAEQLIGSWKNVTANNTIEFGRENNYTIYFGADTAFKSTYQLDTEEGSKLSIQDGDVTYECVYQFLEDNRLKVTRLYPPRSSDIDQTVSIYRRLP